MTRYLPLLIIIIALGLAALWVYQRGAEDVRNATERQNNAAGNQSDDARSRYDLCVDGGGVWDYGSGKCARTPAGGRN
jgi:type II secretory pathway pseudopilin PulG